MMFAVQGWSVSPKSLVTQREPTRVVAPKEAEPRAGSGKSSRKRKRDQAQTKGSTITDENFADLWRKHIEGKSPRDTKEDVQSAPKERRRKRRKNGGEMIQEARNGAGNSAIVGEQKEQGEFNNKIQSESDKEHAASAVTQAHGNTTTSEGPRTSIQGLDPKQDGKARYEQRKAQALEKRKQKSLQQVNGTLPPARPNPSQISSTTSPLPKDSSPPPTSRTAQLDPQKPSPTSSTTQLESQKPPPTPATNTGADFAEHPKPRQKPQPTNPTITRNTTTTATLPPASVSSLAHLTPLQISMRQKLISARFRHLNQTLYTTSSTHASTLFSQSPDSYTSYHAGFRAQVAVWPQNPIDTFIANIKARAQVGTRGRDLGSQKKSWREQRRGKAPNTANKSDDTSGGSEKADPLPRSPRGSCTIADLGCGDATLAAALTPLCKPLSLRTHSFDLAKGDGPNAHLITVADLCGKVPLENGSVDVVILCLALMGTNWPDGVSEAARVLRPGGELWVAEIRSRFVRPGHGGGGGSGKRRIGQTRPDTHADTPLLTDSDHDPAPSTDLRPFIAVFHRRGLALRVEPDLANKMFATLRFVREAHGVSEGGRWNGNDRGGRGDGEGEIRRETEAAVLKACVYKTR